MSLLTIACSSNFFPLDRWSFSPSLCSFSIPAVFASRSFLIFSPYYQLFRVRFVRAIQQRINNYFLIQFFNPLQTALLRGHWVIFQSLPDVYNPSPFLHSYISSQPLLIFYSERPPDFYWFMSCSSSSHTRAWHIQQIFLNIKTPPPFLSHELFGAENKNLICNYKYWSLSAQTAWFSTGQYL